MTTLEIIIAELKRQFEEDTHIAPYIDAADPTDAILDGHFDLVALANAIDNAKLKT